VPRDGTLFGALFESLVAMDLRTYAQNAEASVSHYRDEKGRREVDFVIERPDGRILGVEVKLGRVITGDDVKHLVWLKEQIGDAALDLIVVYAGTEAYRRPDGIGVVPLALLGA
jgi:predicted AAA+ superfamily ATPase